MIEKLLYEYIDMFGDSFPMYQLARGKTDNEIEAIIKKCIDSKKSAYDLGLCTLDEDVIY